MKTSLNKSIPANKLNSRTGAPTTDQEMTIPFGAIVEYLGRDRDFERYKYMGELYRSKHDVFASAMEGGVIPGGDVAEEPAAVTSADAAVAAPAKAKLRFEPVASNVGSVSRAKVPGGWLVSIGGSAVTFYPDAAHAWDGTSIE